MREYVKKFFPQQQRIEKAMERFNTIVEMVENDEVATSLLDSLLNSAEKYFGTVVRMEAQLKIARFRLEGEELRNLTQDLDQRRHYAHEALISDLHIFNRYILKEFDDVPVGGIFSENPEMIRDRVVVADWAGELLCALYVNRKR